MSDSQEAKRERRAREMALATQPNANGLWNPADIKARVDAGVEVPVGARLQFTSLRDLLDMGIGGGGSPVESMGIEQYLAANNMTPQQFQEQYGGLPYVFNSDGTVTYDPSAQRTAFEYTPASYARNQAIGLGLIGAIGGAGLMGLGQGAAGAAAGAGEAAAGAGALDFAGSFAPTITPGTVAQSGLLYTGGSMPTVAGLTGVGGLTAEGAAALGAMGSAGAGLGAGTTGALGSLGLDAAGNIVSQGVNLANSATTAAGLGSAAGAGTTAATTAAQTAAKTGLSKLLQDQLGIDVSSNTLDLIGKGLGLGLGAYASNQQADAAQNLASQYMNMGAPYRAELANLNANPSSFYSSPVFQGALQQGSDALSRSLSAKVGNPILNPTALQEMQNYTTRGSLDAYNNRWNQLASAGQLGTSQAAGLGQAANQAQGQTYNAVGAGLQSVFGNQRDYTGELLDILKNRPATGMASLY